ncbi:ABC transporter ATP-binding protein [uncultured Parabacteroides sp.]|jgi:ABC-type bacteriocin/lantibiotic exporter with double-glycine peptidase domain|uniref:ATP-binding cassette domain-containing protein n=1 Tax=uncultured Parabacteroides sp. TaxID=512312 RepID=UPI0025DC9AC7|nr:ABC transporter ATP-binding protein [uncultured Parabacteroides sp.]
MITLIPSVITRLYKLLPRQYQLRIWMTGFSIFVISVFDLLGTGVLLPILLLVLDETAIEKNQYLSGLYSWGGFDNFSSFLIFICVIILFFSIVRVLVCTWLQYTQNKRLFTISSYLSLKLYNYYYRKGFLYIKQRNSHKLINQVNGISVSLVQGYLVPYTQLICECVVMISILSGLILFNVYVFLLVLVTFVPITLTYYRFSRARIKAYGNMLFQLVPQKGKLLQQTFVGYTDMEMSNSFPQSFKNFQELMEKQNRINVRNLLLNGSLQKALEIAIVCSLVVLILATRFFDLPALGLIIGLFAIAVYRVLPGLVRSTGFVFAMKSNSFSADLLNDLEAEQEETYVQEQLSIDFQKEISLRSLSFSYDKKVQVLNNFSLDIHKGDFIGFRGESGSGKSTLFHLLLGFIQPDQGGIYIDDLELTPDRLAAWRNKIGYVSQQLFMIEGTLLDNIAMSLEKGKADRVRVEYAIRLASLDTFIKTLPLGIDTPIGEGGCLLSGGQRQRLGIARALYKQAEILMFDEATSSLDETTEHTINDAIVRLSEECSGLTLLVISHRSESLAVCRRVVDIQELNNNDQIK